MIRLLTVGCLCAAGLQIAIWSGLVSGWTTLVASPLGDAATKLERATEPRSALTSPADPLNRDVAAAGEENRKLKEPWRETSAAQSARAVADLAAARDENRALTARHREAEKKVSDAVEKLVRERARAEALDRDLAAARQEIRTLKVRQSDDAQQVSAAEQQLLAQKGARVLAQERARAEALDRDLAATGHEIQTPETRQSDGAQQVSAVEQQLAQERARAEALDRDLAAARQQIQTLETRQSDGAQQVSAVEQQLAQERARAEALDRDLAAARQQIQTLETRRSDGAQQVSAAEQELAQERARAEALDRDLAAARQEILTLKVDQANAAQDASAGEPTRARERARAEALAGNLAAVREENRTTVRADAVANNTSVLRPEFPRNENDESALHNSNDPGPTSHTMATAVPSANTLAAVQQNRTPSEAETYDAHMVPAEAIHPLDSNEIASSLRRGDALVASGDVAAARLVLRRAADAGDARAAMTLAGTYDPAILEKLGVRGVVPDLAMARGWYEKAKKFGAVEATQRLELLASRQH
jgi:cell division protein FtsB